MINTPYIESSHSRAIQYDPTHLPRVYSGSGERSGERIANRRFPLLPDGRMNDMRSDGVLDEEIVIQLAIDGRLVLVGDIRESFRRRQ